MRGTDTCNGCESQTSNPWYLMRPQSDVPDQIKAVYCEACAERITATPSATDTDRRGSE